MWGTGASVKWVAPLLLLTTICAGLELNLDLETPGQAVCAVVRCVEDSRPDTTATSGVHQGTVPLKSISSLTIYKKSQSSRNIKQTLGIMVASITPQQPRITQMSNGFKVKGLLDGTRASLTVGIVESGDCFADFTCQLRSVDANGEESESVVGVNQGKRQSQTDSQNLMPPVSLQILDLVHRLDTKLTIEHKSTEALIRKVRKLETKMGTFDNKMGTIENILSAVVRKAADEIETRMEALNDRLEDKIEAAEKDLQATLGSLQNRLEDKLENGVEDKLGEVHMKLMTFTANAESCGEDIGTSLNQSLAALSQSLTNEQKKALTSFTSATQNLLDNRNSATESFLSTVKNLTRAQTTLQDEQLENVTQAVDKLSENVVNIGESLSENFGSIEQELQNSFQQLASIAILSVVKSNLSRAGLVKDSLAPESCMRGMAKVNLPSSYPYAYPLINPSEDSLVDVPYLCDTATDGGGWIIIQRRIKGGVDFYRGWEEYKNGFGELTGDFWLGLEHIHKITSSGPYELRVEIVYKGKPYYARYGRFSIADEADKYRLTVEDYSGTAGESFIEYHNGQQFTTKDKNNTLRTSNCAVMYTAAWWYSQACGYSSLNGKWEAPSNDGPWWYTVSNTNPVSYAAMKVRHL